jgi:hypothetical protein
VSTAPSTATSTDATASRGVQLTADWVKDGWVTADWVKDASKGDWVTADWVKDAPRGDSSTDRD